jgi:lipopolysaccharide biosynthesis glycosyltransferase
MTATAGSRKVLRLIATCDEGFHVGLAVTMQTAVEHLAKDVLLQLHVLGLGWKRRTREKIRQTLVGAGHEVVFYEVRDTPNGRELARTLRRSQVNDRRRLCYFAKLLLPDLLPAADRCLFLDSDIFVNRDLAELYFQPFATHPFKAVADSATGDSRAGLREFACLGLDPHAPLFNSGVFLLDLDYWRRQKLADQALVLIERAATAFAAQSPTLFLEDQILFNLLYYQNWEKLGVEWNRQAPYRCGVVGELREGRRYLFHYLTRPKPWEEPYCDDAKEFYEALDRTALAGWRPRRFWSGLRAKLSYHKYQAWKWLHRKSWIPRPAPARPAQACRALAGLIFLNPGQPFGRLSR